MIDIKNIKAILLDLDDTLVRRLPWITPYFIWKACLALRPVCSPIKTIKALSRAKMASLEEGGQELNWDRFIKVFSEHARIPGFVIEEHLPSIFSACESYFSPIPEAAQFVKMISDRITLVLATNPILPERFARERLRWANIDDQKFKLVTHAQNMRSCKPHKAYYKGILELLALRSEDCILIGDDPEKDGSAIWAGITTILLKSDENLSIWKVLRSKSHQNAALLGANWNLISRCFGSKI